MAPQNKKKERNGEHTMNFIREDANLFDSIGHDLSIVRTDECEVHHTAPLSDTTAPLTFNIQGTDTHYIDISSVELYLRCKITNLTGGNLANTVIVAPVTNFLHSRFSQCSIFLNETQITPPSNNYAVRAYIERLLACSKEFNKGQSIAAMYYKEKDPTSTDHTLASSSYEARFDLTKGSKIFEVCGRPHADLFSQIKYLPPGIDVRIVFHHSTSDFCLHAPVNTGGPAAQEHFIAGIMEARLHVKKHILLPSLQIDHIQRWNNNQIASYPMRKVDVKTYTLAVGSMTSINETLLSGLLPERLVIGLVPTAYYMGTITTNPFTFSDYELSNISVTYNGDHTDVRIMDVDFRDGTKRVLRAYQNIYKGLGIANCDAGLDYTMDDFLKYKTLFVYDFGNVSEVCTRPNYGNIKIELKFRTALTDALTVVCYTESQSVLHIDKHKNIFFKDTRA